MAERRKDSKKRVLKEGEYQRANGTYEYRWRSENRKRNYIYAKSLEELREKEAELSKDKSDGIRTEARNVSINDVYELWVKLKRGLKDNTFSNYQYIYLQLAWSKRRASTDLKSVGAFSHAHFHHAERNYRPQWSTPERSSNNSKCRL